MGQKNSGKAFFFFFFVRNSNMFFDCGNSQMFWWQSWKVSLVCLSWGWNTTCIEHKIFSSIISEFKLLIIIWTSVTWCSSVGVSLCDSDSGSCHCIQENWNSLALIPVQLPYSLASSLIIILKCMKRPTSAPFSFHKHLDCSGWMCNSKWKQMKMFKLRA